MSPSRRRYRWTTSTVTSARTLIASRFMSPPALSSGKARARESRSRSCAAMASRTSSITSSGSSWRMSTTSSSSRWAARGGELLGPHGEEAPGAHCILDLGEDVVAAGGVDAAPGRVAVARGEGLEPVRDLCRMELVERVAQGPASTLLEELRQPFVRAGRAGRGRRRGGFRSSRLRGIYAGSDSDIVAPATDRCSTRTRRSSRSSGCVETSHEFNTFDVTRSAMNPPTGKRRPVRPDRPRQPSPERPHTDRAAHLDARAQISLLAPVPRGGLLAGHRLQPHLPPRGAMCGRRTAARPRSTRR